MFYIHLGLSAPADEIKIVPTKSKDKFFLLWCICTKNVEAVKSCHIWLTAKNNTDVIFHCDLFNLIVRTKTSNVLAHFFNFLIFIFILD